MSEQAHHNKPIFLSISIIPLFPCSWHNGCLMKLGSDFFYQIPEGKHGLHEKVHCFLKREDLRAIDSLRDQERRRM
jgi:hypothetical protein